MNGINFLVKSLILGYALYNKRTKNRYWIVTIDDNFHMIQYNENTMNVSIVSTPEEDLSIQDEWTISQPERNVEFI